MSLPRDNCSCLIDTTLAFGNRELTLGNKLELKKPELKLKKW